MKAQAHMKRKGVNWSMTNQDIRTKLEKIRMYMDNRNPGSEKKYRENGEHPGVIMFMERDDRHWRFGIRDASLLRKRF
jgi:hypothetical protein